MGNSGHGGLKSHRNNSSHNRGGRWRLASVSWVLILCYSPYSVTQWLEHCYFILTFLINNFTYFLSSRYGSQILYSQILKYVLISAALDCFFFVKSFIRILIKNFRDISGTRIVYRERKDLEFFSLLKVVPEKKRGETLFLFIKAFSFCVKIWLRPLKIGWDAFFSSHKSLWEITETEPLCRSSIFPRAWSASH